MPPDELRAALAALNLSQVRAARWLDIGERSMREYCSGDVRVPSTMAKLLRLVIALKLTPEQVTEMTDEHDYALHGPRFTEEQKRQQAFEARAHAEMEDREEKRRGEAENAVDRWRDEQKRQFYRDLEASQKRRRR